MDRPKPTYRRSPFPWLAAPGSFDDIPSGTHTYLEAWVLRLCTNVSVKDKERSLYMTVFNVTMGGQSMLLGRLWGCSSVSG